MDTIGDFLSQIRNAYLVGKKKVEIPWSKAREALAKLLVTEGYLGRFKVEKIDKVKRKMILDLKYDQKMCPVITGIKRISKPGRRFYTVANKIPWLLEGVGITIISTSEGLMSDKKARKKNLGGEVICQIY